MATSSLILNLIVRDQALGSLTRTQKGLAAIGTAGVAAGVGLAAMFPKFIADARESAKVTRLTEAVVKSTGGAANITAKQVSALSMAISNKTGVDDEAIQSGQNLLLTFTNIRNETGKGNDVFNRASAAVTDMTAALNNGDVSAEKIKGSSIMLGKALNDPIKGMSSLTRAGVSFTEQQKAQVATLVESGQTLEAQKVILNEVGRQFGGAAAAAADPMTRLKVTLGNLSETIGAKLLPVVDRFALWLAGDGITYATQFGNAIRPLGGVLAGFASGLQRAGEFLARNREVVVPLVAAVGGFAVVLVTVTKAMKAFAAVQAALWALMAVNPFVLVVAGVAALAAGLVVAYKRSETFRNIVDGAFAAVKAAVMAVLPSMDSMKAAVETVGDAFKTGFRVVSDVVQTTFRGVQVAWTSVLRPTFDAIVTGAKVLGDGFQLAFSVLSTIVRATFRVVAALWQTVLRPVFDGIVNGAKLVGEGVKLYFGVLATLARTYFRAVQLVWQAVLRPVFDGIVNGAKLVGEGVRLYFNGLATIARTAFRVVQTVWQSVLRPVFDQIVNGARLLAEGFKLYFRAVSTVVQTTFRLTMTLWQTVLKVAFTQIVNGARLLAEGFKLYFRAVSTVVQTTFRLTMTLWQTVLKVAFNQIVNGARLLADGFKLYFRAVSTVVQTTFRLTMTLWQTVLKVAFQQIQAGARALMAALQAAFRAISAAVSTAFSAVRTVWQNVLRPTFDAVMTGGRTVRQVITTSINGAKDAVSAAFNAIRGVWNSVLSPTFNRIQDSIKAVRKTFEGALDGIKGAFSRAADGIGNAWSRIISLVRGPASIVYGVIKSLHGVLKKFAGFFGVPVGDLPGFSTSGGGGGTGRRPAGSRVGGFATGGITRGYTPGRDNQLIAVSGGEAIMRPEWTRAVGPGFVHSMNAAARHGGVSGVQRAMGLQGFDLGGIVKGIKNKITGTAGAIMDVPQKAWEYLSDPTKFLGPLAKPILGRLGDLPGGAWGDTLRAAPKKLWSAAIDKIKSGLSGIFGGSGGGGGAYSPGLAGAMAFARAHAGRPYQWGGPRFVGDSFDCSGYLNAIAAVAQGGNPWQRAWYTGNYSIPRFRPGGGGAFTIGVSSAAELGMSAGHTAGTINGMNVESRGGRGTLIGPAARGAYDPMFRRHYSLIGFNRGGVVGGDPPFDVIDPRGKAYNPVKAKQLGFDAGGLMRGRGFMPKYTSSPERVLSPRQTAAFESWMARGSGGGETHIHIENNGVMGSRMEVENWLASATASLKRQGRL